MNKTDSNYLLFSETFRKIVSQERLTVVDAGARGELMNPWLAVPVEAINLVGFEPDKEECSRLVRELHDRGLHEARTYFPTALWNHKGVLTLHVGKRPATSSIHPPNEKILMNYLPDHHDQRITVGTTSVECDTLDAVLQDQDIRCDFLKLDTQGSEYEILEGAENALRNEVFGILAETWTVPVHEGQYLTSDILKLAESHGFSLFDVYRGASWSRWKKSEQWRYSKRQVVVLDLLFFKDPTLEDLKTMSFAGIVKRAAIAEVYGFPDLAVQILERAKAAGHQNRSGIDQIKAAILANSKKNTMAYRRRRSILGRMRNAIALKLGKKKSRDLAIAPLH